MKQATSRSIGVVSLLIVCCGAAAGFSQRTQRGTAPQDRPAQTGPQWEYMLVVGGLATDAQHQQAMTNSLNEYGKAGWELTTVTVTPSLVSNYIFKRPKR
jgi:hypothetical protein